MRVKTWTAATLTLAGTLLATVPAAAQAYPARTIKFIVPFAAGGGSDAAGRTIASGLEKATGRTFTTENREGGSGAVGYS